MLVRICVNSMLSIMSIMSLAMIGKVDMLVEFIHIKTLLIKDVEIARKNATEIMFVKIMKIIRLVKMEITLMMTKINETVKFRMILISTMLIMKIIRLVKMRSHL